MRILNTITTYKPTELGIALAIVGIVFALLVFLIALSTKESGMAIVSFVILFLLFLVSSVAERKSIPNISYPVYQYEAIVLDDHANEMLAEYDVIDRRGEIYVLEERE